MQTTRRQLLHLAVAGALGVLPAVTWAQAFPSRPMTIVVPYAPGGAPDQLARQLATALSKSMGQAIVVENKPGASGNIGAAFVAKARPDGHTILLATQPMVTINPLLFKSMGYDPAQDLTPITAAVNVVLVLAVNASLPVKSLADLIAYAKKNPVAYGTSGIGTPMHLAGLQLGRQAGVNLTHVAYRGAAQNITDLLGGSIQMSIVDLVTARQFADQGKLKILAIGENARFTGAPQIPTTSETLPGFGITSWFGFFGPAGMPSDVVERWSTEISKAMNDPDMQKRLFNQGMTSRAEGPAALAALVKKDAAFFTPIVRENNITIE